MTTNPLMPPPEFLADASALGLEFEPGEVEQLGRFLGMLLEANKSFNLTAITEPTEAWRRHILDALTLVPVLAGLEGEDEGAELKVIDVGSGGGVPGVPLAICLPRVRFVLLDATGKKCEFLRRAAADLGLKNVEVIQGRAERLGQEHKVHREMYDAAIARAVGSLSILSELCLPLVKVGGVFLAIKGAKAEEELAAAGKAIKMLGGEHDQTIVTPTGKIVVVAKVARTVRIYPRADGEPTRVPLGS
ncbi:MAG: 16S rRNA (guanine(527)-N(7))-methyltransferase RsmG [Phycisphaerales bacterium]